MSTSRILLFGAGATATATAIASFFIFDLGQYLSLLFLREQQAAFADSYAARPVATVATFFVLYVAVRALSLPGAAIMTLAAGALFGLLTGTVRVSFASSIGTTLAFLASRFLFRDVVQQRFASHMKKINDGVDRDLVVIGAGSGGLVSACIAAAVKAKVSLIEADRMGGDCLNTGCVPSKTLICSAKTAHELRHAQDFSVHAGAVNVDFPAVMERVQAAIASPWDWS